VAYTVATEPQAAAAEWVLDGLDALYDCFVANIAVMIGQGSTALTAANIFRSFQHDVARFPAMRIQPQGSIEARAIMGPTGVGQRRLTLNYTVECLEKLRGTDKVLRSSSQLADRAREVLARNTSLDGFCTDLLVTPGQYGFYSPSGGFVNAARLTVAVDKWVDIL